MGSKFPFPTVDGFDTHQSVLVCTGVLCPLYKAPPKRENRAVACEATRFLPPSFMALCWLGPGMSHFAGTQLKWKGEFKLEIVHTPSSEVF